MTERRTDPLLTTGKVLSIIMQASMAMGLVALVIGVAALVLFGAQITGALRAELGDPAASFPVWAAVGVMLIGMAIVSLMFVFFGKLRQIIATVGEGDPFVAENADRLSLMAWLLLGAQLMFIPAMPLAMRLTQFADEVGESGHDLDFGGGLDLSGIIMVIVLFILARVFRKGTEMRDELEGTV